MAKQAEAVRALSGFRARKTPALLLRGFYFSGARISSK